MPKILCGVQILVFLCVYTGQGGALTSGDGYRSFP